MFYRTSWRLSFRLRISATVLSRCTTDFLQSLAVVIRLRNRSYRLRGSCNNCVYTNEQDIKQRKEIKMKNDENVQDENNDEPVIVDGILLIPNDEVDENVNDVTVNQNRKETIGKQAGSKYELVGIISVVFGIIVFIYLLISSNQGISVSFLQFGSGISFGELAISFGISLLFIVPGVICIGIGAIFTQLEEKEN